MKIALVHDYLCGIGGSERVFQYICEAFPEGDIYTLAYNPQNCFPFFRSQQVHTTWLNPLVQNATLFRWMFPLATRVMQRLDFSSYDLIISSSATTAKYITKKNAIHICYCYIPTRALWHFDAYFPHSIKASLLKLALPYLQKKDLAAAQRIDRFITISEISKKYIEEYYHRESIVLPSPIDCSLFALSRKRDSHYLLVSRLEPWKRVDIAVQAFAKLGLPLRICGQGSEEARLRALATPNIEFLGEVDDETLAREYQRCKAVIFTPALEYGLVPLEAAACGTPVIAFGKGGIRETMIGANAENCTHFTTAASSQQVKPTAVFFYEQTPQALAAAIEQFQQIEFDPYYLRNHALQWDVPAFKDKFRNVVLQEVEALLNI